MSTKLPSIVGPISTSSVVVDMTNVRVKDARDTPGYAELVASIKADGLQEGLIFTLDAKGVPHLDAGNRRFAACEDLGVDVWGYGYKRGLDSKERVRSQALENAKEPLTWQEKAAQCLALQKSGYKSPKVIAKRICLSDKVVSRYMTALKRLEACVVGWSDADRDAAYALGVRDVEALTEHGAAAPTAFAEYQKTGKMPVSGKKSKAGKRGEGGGRPPTGKGLSWKKASEQLRAEFPTVNWDAVRDNFPPRSEEQIDALLAALYPDAEEEGEEETGE